MTEAMFHRAEKELHAVLLTIVDEFKRAADKHGVAKTPVNPLMTDAVKFGILVEEAGEAAELCPCHGLMVKMGDIARAMTYDEGDTEKLKAELLQVSTMAATWLVGILLREQLEADTGSV
jgi:hypothetical protein